MKLLVNKLSRAIALLTLAGAAVTAQAEQTGPLTSEEGYVDPGTGARVEAVDKSFWTGKTRVLVSIPAAEGREAVELEEVVVTAKRPEEQGSDLQLRYKFLKDYSDDRYGMYIYLGKNQQLPFRIYFKDTASDVLLNREP